MSLLVAVLAMGVVQSAPVRAQSTDGAADLAVRFLALAVGGGEEGDDGGCFFYDGGCQFGDTSCTELLEWGDDDACPVPIGCVVLGGAAVLIGVVGGLCSFTSPADAGEDAGLDAPTLRLPDSLTYAHSAAVLFLPPSHPAFRHLVTKAEADGVDVLVGRRLLRPKARRGVGLGVPIEASPEVEWTAYDVKRRAFIPFAQPGGLEAHTLRARVPATEAEAFADRLRERLQRTAPGPEEPMLLSADADHSISR